MPKGMILAAGRGVRLGPLTASRPKPLLPVANEPVMAQALRSLRRLGVTEVSANVSYRAEQILETFGDGSTFDISLHWLIEDKLTGTAGGMKGMQRYLQDDLVVVIAGDAMLDVELAPLLTAHRERDAFATLATVHVQDPSHYGVVVAEADGRIREFQEKPAPGTEISRWANTGIYVFDPGIFDLIPAGELYDFALHVFPDLLRRKLPFYAIPVAGYWTDIGNPADYLRANIDFLTGRIRLVGLGERVGSNLVGDGAQIAGGRYRNCVIGSRVSLPPGCELDDCVVWDDTHLAEPVTLTAAILTPDGIYCIRGKEAEVVPCVMLAQT